MVNHDMLALGTCRSAIRDMFEYGRQRAKIIGAENVFDFSLGNPSVPPPDAVTEAFLDTLKTGSPIDIHGYTSAPGADDVRDAIARNLNFRYGTDFTSRNLYLTCGAAAALTCVFRALTLHPQTEFIAFAPYFPEYACFCATGGAKLRVIPADTAQFQIRFDALEQAITPETQGVILNSPNNPSGTIYGSETIRRLATLLTEKSRDYGHPIYLISDEPYRELIYSGEPYPLPTQYYANTIICYSYSKSLSLPGDRIGYILLGNAVEQFEDVFSAFAGAARSLGYVCAPNILQQVVKRCSYLDVQPDLTPYRKNRDALQSGLTAAGYRCAPPDGAFYLFIEAPGGDGDAFCAAARQQDVLLVSGKSFGCPSFVRLSYCVSYETILGALPRLRTLYPSVAKNA